MEMRKRAKSDKRMLSFAGGSKKRQTNNNELEPEKLQKPHYESL